MRHSQPGDDMPFAFATLEGTTPIRSDPRAFLAAFARRVASGLFPGAPALRTRYSVTREGADALQFRAANWPTATNVGLNEVELSPTSDGRVRYTVRYPRWAIYALGLGDLIGLSLIAFFVLFDIRGYLERHPDSTMPGLSLDQNVAFAWAMALFWGFVWPWVLIFLHKKPLRTLIEGLIAEVDAGA
jgi:hypothetical protein